jgi:hypothetical protein
VAYWIPTFVKDMTAYLSNPHAYNYGMWDAPDPGNVNGPYGPGVPGEGGVDLGSPIGTPVYALQDGQVVGVGYWKDQGHGVVTIRCSIPGYGTNDMYYQHIIPDSNIHMNAHITRGQKIGVVGQYSEVEIGLNANWGGIWGINHPQGWVTDPRPQIKALMALGQPGSTPDVLTSGSNVSTGTSGSNPIQTNFLIRTGEWIAENIFKVNPTVVQTSEVVSTAPYQLLGGVVLALAAMLIAFVFISLIGLT